MISDGLVGRPFSPVPEGAKTCWNMGPSILYEGVRSTNSLWSLFLRSLAHISLLNYIGYLVHNPNATALGLAIRDPEVITTPGQFRDPKRHHESGGRIPNAVG